MPLLKQTKNIVEEIQTFFYVFFIIGWCDRRKHYSTENNITNSNRSVSERCVCNVELFILCVLHVLHKSNCLSFKRNCEHVCIYFLNIVLQIKDAANVFSRYCLSRLYALPLLPICICLSVKGKQTLPIEKLIFRNGQPVRDDVRGIFISMVSTKGQCILVLCSFCVSR